MSPERPLVLIGAGKMGGALLDGWLASGVDPAAVVVVEPQPDPGYETLKTPGLTVVDAPPQTPASIIVIAVKPHLVGDVLPHLGPTVDGETLLVSIAAGVKLKKLAESGARALVRAMPNTPASVGKGATVGVASGASEAQVAEADTLLSAVGRTWWLDEEDLLDAVTAVSGSGPAYVFHMVEALAAAGEKAGLPAELAAGLARQTVVGAGALLAASPLDPGTLRANVTSKGGTTAAALGVLRETGRLTTLMEEAVAAAAERSRELGS